MRDSIRLPYVAVLCFLLTLTLPMGPVLTEATAQESSSETAPAREGLEQLPSVEIEAPTTARRQSQARTGAREGGFGSSEPIPSGQPGSDFPLTPGEVVSTGGRTQNLANVPSAVSIVQNRGIESQGYTGVPNMIQGLPGVYTSGFSGTPFDSNVVLRGFSVAPANRVLLLYDGRSLNTPMQDANFMSVFPELIDRIEVLRGDGTVQFGTKAIGGAVNIIPKRPRQNPGTFWGAEVGSWQTDREWVASNMVRGPLAAGLFAGRYSTDGFRLYEGNGLDEEFLPRPGPWRLQNIQGSLNWKITPNLTFEISQLLSESRIGYGGSILRPEWERRDIRNVAVSGSGAATYSPAWDGPIERGDSVTIARLLYEGGKLGTLEVIGSYFKADLRINGYSYWGLSDRRWLDQGLSFKYFRTDKYSVVTNELTVGSDLWDGRFGREGRNIDQSSGANNIVHRGEQSGYRESISYYVMNQTRFWDRFYVDLGYRIQNYDLKDLYANDADRVVTNAHRVGRDKSASQWAVGLVYDKELGSSVYYKHSRMYRFPEFWDMVKTGMPGYPAIPPFVLLDPEEGTLEEVGIRHWFNRNIYVGVVYYEQDMDTEILYGLDELGHSANMNVQDVSHCGVELDALVRITPRWTVKGNWTRQKVLVRSNFLPGLTPLNGLTTEDKWLFQNPAEMANLSLEYNNRDWGFSGMIKYYYIGSRFRANDAYNIQEPLEPAKWGDLAVSQNFFDNAATVYFGIRNFSDAQYSILGTTGSPSTYYPLGNGKDGWYPNEGRTYYGGLKATLDFDRIKVPTREDLNRMQRRLYGSVRSGVDNVYGFGARIRNLASF